MAEPEITIRVARLGLRPELWLARADLVATITKVADQFRAVGAEREAAGAEAVREVVEALHP